MQIADCRLQIEEGCGGRPLLLALSICNLQSAICNHQIYVRLLQKAVADWKTLESDPALLGSVRGAVAENLGLWRFMLAANADVTLTELAARIAPPEPTP